MPNPPAVASTSNNVNVVTEAALETWIQVANKQGIYLRLDDDHMASPARREVVKNFLNDMMMLQRAEGNNTSSAGKRKRPFLNPVCEHCKEQFVEGENTDESCRYHAGMIVYAMIFCCR